MLAGMTSSCLLWTGARHERGYGRVRFDGRIQSAHRVSWALAHKEAVPDHLHVLHRCDMPACVNPDHLYLGTQRQNMADRVSRGTTLGPPKTIEEAERRLAIAQGHLEKSIARVEGLKQRIKALAE
jgi:hypothetical protein